MLKQWLRIVGVGCCVIALAACSSTKKKAVWQADVYDANQTAGAQSMGLGDDEGYEIIEGGTLTDAQITSGQKIYFAYNKYSIESAYNPIVKANINYLQSHPHAKVRIEGYTDEVGSREYNIALGEHRANVVKNALTSQGVNESQVTTVSYGKEYPVQACVTAHKQRCQLNRRAVIVYTDMG